LLLQLAFKPLTASAANPAEISVFQEGEREAKDVQRGLIAAHGVKLLQL